MRNIVLNYLKINNFFLKLILSTVIILININSISKAEL